MADFADCVKSENERMIMQPPAKKRKTSMARFVE